MSGNQPQPTRPPAAPGSIELRVDPLRTLIPFELRRNFLRSRIFTLFLLASLPVVLLLIRALFAPQIDASPMVGESSLFYAATYQTFMARFIIFFGCLTVFTELFRSEVWLDQRRLSPNLGGADSFVGFLRRFYYSGEGTSVWWQKLGAIPATDEFPGFNYG